VRPVLWDIALPVVLMVPSPSLLIKVDEFVQKAQGIA